MKKDINEAKYLELEKLTQERGLELRVCINEARIDAGKTISVGPFTGGRIGTDDSCERYEFVFQHYVRYSVTNECFAKVESDAIVDGRLFRIYTKSKFLDYARSTCIRHEELASGLKHYQFLCLNHIIDIATANPPSSP